MDVTFQGNPLTLEGKQLKVGDKLPDFTLTANDLSPYQAKDGKGVRVFVVVPSVDTGVCDLEVRNFNQKADQLPGVSICAVSVDLPFAQSRWCGAAGVSAVKTYSDYKDRSFGMATGTFIKELAILTRAVFIVDSANVLQYVEYVPEMTDHPKYDAVYAALQGVK